MPRTDGSSELKDFWSAPCRLVVFCLAATSIACLLAEFYGVCSMRRFTLLVFLPALAALVGLALVDRAYGTRRLWRGVILGAVAGLLAAVAYDVFRLPFVFAQPLGIVSVLPPLPLFKVFPRFGAMILGQALEQPRYSLAAQWTGWSYHFSNGLTFGIMYLAMVGDATKRHWGWAVVMAVGLELAMLVTPYPKTFGIQTTTTFVIVTLAAHVIFGVALGRSILALGRMGRIDGTGAG
jgi:hypothetical protein